MPCTLYQKLSRKSSHKFWENLHNFKFCFLCTPSNYTNFKKVLDFSGTPSYIVGVIEETSYGNMKNSPDDTNLKTVSSPKRINLYLVGESQKGEQTMKITNISNIEGFFNVVDQCKGTVELVTGEGDRLNLKSKLSQYVSLATIFSKGEVEIPELELVAHEPEDITRLIEFMMSKK